MSHTYLFVGGPRDGKRMEVGHKKHFINVAVPKPASAPSKKVKPSDIAADERTYEKRFFRESDMTPQSAFFHTSIPLENSFQALIAGYRPENPSASSTFPDEDPWDMLDIIIETLTRSHAIRAASIDADSGASIIVWDVEAKQKLGSVFNELAAAFSVKFASDEHHQTQTLDIMKASRERWDKPNCTAEIIIREILLTALGVNPA